MTEKHPAPEKISINFQVFLGTYTLKVTKYVPGEVSSAELPSMYQVLSFVLVSCGHIFPPNTDYFCALL